ncbi:alpha-tocopherol transfer protein-like [Adelges cooleyi]|uniref:alpha-tocopherol transfer protein-like n=1 Tax=Adelges cooleyi TaxID=133065 RepID=UPI00217F5C3A|nr:alpha-tocopherol transfer protein-like [Adelges cooleyi]
METNTLVLPTPSTISKIYSDLGTSETQIDLDVKLLKEWMRKQPHLPNPDDAGKIIDEKRIKMFLIMCKNSLEKTKVKLDQYYSIKVLLPEYSSNLDPTSPEILQAMKICSNVPLPNPTHEGHRVSVFCLRNEDVDKYVFNDAVKLCAMTFDLRIAKLDSFNKNIFIFDSNNCSMNHVTAMLPNTKKLFGSAFVAYPIRIHEIHVINHKSFLQPLTNISLKLVKKKIADRVFFHKSIEELKNYIDPSILPPNYGGTFPKTLDEIIDEWHNELIRHREWLITQSTIVADNSKRPKNSNNILDSTGNAIEGSFRTLEVD